MARAATNSTCVRRDRGTPIGVGDLAAPRPAARRRRAGIARRASTAASSSGSVSRSRAASWAASAPARSRRARSGCRRAAGRGGRAGRRSSGSSQTSATTRSTSSSWPEQRVGLGEHLGAVAGVDVARRRRRRRSAGSASVGSWPASASRAARKQLIAGDAAAGRDPPQGDLHDVLAPPCAVALDDVGELVLDPSQPQRRQPGPQHLAVERVGEAHGGPPSRRDHHDDEPARLQRLERGHAVDAARGRRGRSARTRRAARARRARRHRRRRGARRPARRARRSSAAGPASSQAPPTCDEHAAFRGAAHELGEHCRLPPDSRASSASARGRHRTRRAPGGAGRRARRASSGSSSRRTRCPSRWRPVSRGDGVRPVRTVPMRKTRPRRR